MNLFNSIAPILAGVLTLTGAKAMAADLSDAQISSIVMTANEGEVAAGKLAESKATNKDVKEFAAHMVKEHSKNEADVKSLATKLKLKPEANPKQAELKADAEKKGDSLKKLAAKDFDKGYMNVQVEMHQAVLNELSTELIPSAKTPDMKSFLETTKQHVQSHLEQAQKIQTALNK